MLDRINELSRKINHIGPSTFPISLTVIGTPLLVALLPWAERSSSPKETRGANDVTLDGTVRPSKPHAGQRPQRYRKPGDIHPNK